MSFWHSACGSARRMNTRERLCDHCEGILTSNAYRVISKDNGITLLDMIVCPACVAAAERLGLKTEELTSGNKQSSERG
jgi:superfamily II helicase